MIFALFHCGVDARCNHEISISKLCILLNSIVWHFSNILLLYCRWLSHSLYGHGHWTCHVCVYAIRMYECMCAVLTNAFEVTFRKVAKCLNGRHTTHFSVYLSLCVFIATHSIVVECDERTDLYVISFRKSAKIQIIKFNSFVFCYSITVTFISFLFCCWFELLQFDFVVKWLRQKSIWNRTKVAIRRRHHQNTVNLIHFRLANCNVSEK